MTETKALSLNSTSNRRPPYSTPDLFKLEAIAATGRPIMPSERLRLEARRDEIAAGLQPSPRGILAEALMDMLRMFNHAPRSEDEWVRYVATYVEIMQDLPLWAIKLAIDAWLHGASIAQARFAPTPPELYQATERTWCEAFREEHRKIVAGLAASLPPPPEPAVDRAAVIKRMEAEMGPGFGIGPDLETEQAKAEAARRRADIERANVAGRNRMFAEAGMEVPTGKAAEYAPSPALLDVLDRQRAAG